jgi:hypothetical protein
MRKTPRYLRQWKLISEANGYLKSFTDSMSDLATVILICKAYSFQENVILIMGIFSVSFALTLSNQHLPVISA